MGLLDIVLQSIVLSVLSNILAQMIQATQNQTSLWAIDSKPIKEFVIYTIVNVPINVLWQRWLESMFPSTKKVAEPATEKKAKGTQDVAQSNKKTQLSVTNTLIKFAMDQTVGAVINIPIFITTIGLMQGKRLDQIVATIISDFPSIYVAGAKLWPAVSLISFAAIPAERRVIFGSIAGVFWNIYLSLRASK